MNNVYITGFFLIFFFSSCSSQSNEFINHEKWEISGNPRKAKVRSNPVSVVETFYSNLNDTAFSDSLKGKLSGTINYKFDKEGNIIGINVLMDNRKSDFFYRIDADGQHYENMAYILSDTSRGYLRSKKIAHNIYKRDTYRKGEKAYSEIWKFEEQGNTVTKERYFRDILGFTVKEFYEDGLLKKSTKAETYLSSEDVYHYSTNNYLDSMIVFMKNTAQMKFIYFNNSHGDPIYYEESVAGNIKKRQWMKYRYDGNGNWIDMMQRTEEENNFNGFSESKKYPDFRWVKRQFKY